MPAQGKGLAGVVAGQTTISEVYGQEGRLVYRGYDIHDLAANTTFEEVAYLLWNGDLPTASQLDALKKQMAAQRALPEMAVGFMRHMPNNAAPMDVLRTVVSMLGIEDQQPPSIAQAINLTAKVPTILAAFHRLRQGLEPIEPRADLSHTGNYIYMLTGKDPTPVAAESLGTYFVLLADHSFNASTFVARIIASTESDMYSAVSGALGALKGPLHGGAPSLVLEMLQEINTPDRAEEWIRAELSRGRPIMGMGHRIYKAEDPRAEILRELSRKVSEPKFFELAQKTEESALRILHEAKPGARIYTNVEFYSAATLYAAGLPPDLFTPTFAASRTAGYTAHILEQVEEHTLIRPNAEYTGPAKRQVKALDERK